MQSRFLTHFYILLGTRLLDTPPQRPALPQDAIAPGGHSPLLLRSVLGVPNSGGVDGQRAHVAATVGDVLVCRCEEYWTFLHTPEKDCVSKGDR